MKGEVDITDSTMSITTNGIPSLSKIVLITKRENNKQFKVVAENQTDLDIRITFSPNPNIQKKEETFILLTEAKDNFTKQFMNVMYYLIPKAE
jgi:5-hydroxyisourate hydrolase-like protein (transthyretin family)